MLRSKTDYHKNRISTAAATPFVSLLFTLLLYKRYKTSAQQITRTSITCFMFPARKKTIIFLRAPYKNKLARLNILKIENKFKITIGFSRESYVLINNFDLKLKFFSKLNLSAVKLKHIKSVVTWPNKYLSNFCIKNYV